MFCADVPILNHCDLLRHDKVLFLVFKVHVFPGKCCETTNCEKIPEIV